ncbi:MAG: glycosyltransferase [Pseudomonadota bacterium]
MSPPTVSVVIRTRNEANRLRLTLASLERQLLHEVFVVDDCSSDYTHAVVQEAAESGSLPVRYLRNARNLGRSAASNAGARAATGDVVLFLDGDTLAGPDCVALHAAAHARRGGFMGRGETLHLRCTRFLQDPETASPRPGEEARLARMPAAERERLRVTREQIRNDFASVAARAEYGIYPGAAPRRLYELELKTIREQPDCELLWVAAVGSNFSVDRAAFLAVGGFDDTLDLNEHRELALRLHRHGHRIGHVDGARTYHMTHRSGWRDPLAISGWEEVLYRRHPIAAVKMLAVFWAGLADASPIPPGSRIASLSHLEERLRELSEEDIDALRALVPGLPRLTQELAGAGG